ncbi:hypothetical protein GVN20_05635 [Runella sp. CRIBMP]|uniref:hypothetical protein n=1 Tax=Runella sp. CRIBMP TaxID=2683261 RepID=UPI00141228F0|nr:hypothetical protein [Runella sp. CRIBMP]NBB18831.1 hypothetical protein [Runella sp. CRIBMP]
MATDKAIVVGGEPTPKAPEPIYEVVGLKAHDGEGIYKKGSIMMKINGVEVDLAKATQEDLKKLYEAGKRFVRIAPAK